MSPTCEMLKNVGAQLYPPATEEMIREVELRYRVTIPPGARELYKEANGAVENFGGWTWNFWPVDGEEVRLCDYFKRPRTYETSGRKIDPAKYLRFFDVLIDAPIYAYCADAASPHFGEVLAIYSDHGTFEADVATRSVTTFLYILTKSQTDDALIFE